MQDAGKHRQDKPSGADDTVSLGEAPTVCEAGAETRTLTTAGGQPRVPFRVRDAEAVTLVMPILQPGRVVKHYEIIRQLGAGGMGTVVLARDTRLGRLVAVKFLLHYTGSAAHRFLKEARATAQCRHENIVVIYDVDEYDGYPYMVLEYIEGRTLRAAMADYHPDAAKFAVEAMLPVARALVRAHDMGIVHRDLKPENILVSNDGQIKVLDFGIAKQVSETHPESTSAASPVEAKRPDQTQEGVIIGTLAYMSPEQIRGETIDARTDIWAAGIVLYEMLAGEHPLENTSLARLAAFMRLEDPLPSLQEQRPDLGALGEIVDRCLRKRKEERFGSAKEFVAALERLGMSFETADTGEHVGSGKKAGMSNAPPAEAVSEEKPREDVRPKKRFGRAYFGVAGLAVAALVVGGVVAKRPPPVASVALPVTLVSAIECGAAEVADPGTTPAFADALGKGACARLGIELGVPWQVAGSSRVTVRADLRGDKEAHVTLELAGRTAEGVGKTAISATNDAIEKLAPMVSVPPMTPERIAGWGARDEMSARRIERGFRRFSFGFATRGSVAEKLLVTDADSPVPHALAACDSKSRDPARARAEKAEARKRLSQMSEKRAKLMAGGMGVFIPTPDDDPGSVTDMLKSYTELSEDPDFAGLFTMCGCFITDTSGPMIDWLAKHARTMGLPIVRCTFRRDLNPEQIRQYFDWVDSGLPEMRGRDMDTLLRLRNVEEAQAALIVKEKLGAELVDPNDLLEERGTVALAAFDPQRALEAGDELIGQPDLSALRAGAQMRVQALLLAGRVREAEASMHQELWRLAANEENDAKVFGVAALAMQIRRLLGHGPLPEAEMRLTRERMMPGRKSRRDVSVASELALLPGVPASVAKSELDAILGNSDPDFRELNLQNRTAFSLPLVRRIRGDRAAATAYREFNLRGPKWLAALEAALVFEAIGAKEEAERAYRLSMEGPWYHPFDAMAARVRLAALLRADGREDEARKVLAEVDKAWVKADPGLREAVLQWK